MGQKHKPVGGKKTQWLLFFPAQNLKKKTPPLSQLTMTTRSHESTQTCWQGDWVGWLTSTLCVSQWNKACNLVSAGKKSIKAESVMMLFFSLSLSAAHTLALRQALGERWLLCIDEMHNVMKRECDSQSAEAASPEVKWRSFRLH